MTQPAETREVTEAHFPPVEVSVRHARRWLREVLEPWDEAVPGDVAELLVTELASNAVVHAGTSFAVRVRLLGPTLRLEVEDASPEPPREMHFAPDATAGRGVSIVRRLARRSGVERDGTHKCVWVEVPLESPER